MVSNPFKRSDKDAPDPAQEEQEMAAQMQSAGANVETFDENSSPEAKGRAALKARDEVKPRGQFAEHQEAKAKAEAEKLNRSVHSDMLGKRVRPNVNLKDVDQASHARGQLGGDQLIPGALPAGSPSLDVPDWFKIGWISNSRYLLGLQPSELHIQQDRLRDTSLVNAFLDDAYYGYLWFDGAAIIASVALTYILTRLGGGIAFATIIAAIGCTYYTTSTRRTRQRVRDDVARELARHRMLTENESAGWINHFLSRFWLIYEPVLSGTIIQQVDQVLRDNCPPFLDSLRLTTFTLGTKPPMIDSVRTLVDTEDDVIVMDWKLSFTPNDVQDMPVRKAAERINPKIVLTVRVGKGMVGAGLPVLLENMSFVGMLRIRLKLIPSFPHVQMVDLSFMQPPSFDYELKPVGGSTFGLDVSALPGLSGFIQNQIHAALSPMMYSPNQFTLNLEDMLSGTPLDATCGVLQVTIWNARNLERLGIEGGAPNAYVSVSLNGGPEIDRTRTREADPNPTYRETKYVLLKELEGLLTLTPMEDNGSLPPLRLGTTRFDLSSLHENPSPGRMNKALMYSDEPVGSIMYSLDYFPIMKPEVGPDGQLMPLPETAAGVLRLTLHQARALPKSAGVRAKSGRKACLKLNKKLVRETNVVREPVDPVFEDVSELLVIERFGSTVTVDIVEPHQAKDDTVMASLTVKIDDIIQASKRKQDWFPFPGNDDARMRLSAQWKPILMSGSINGSNSYRPAIGILKFWMRGAHDVKNVEALSGGKSDPYAMLSVNNIPVHGTCVIDDTLTPQWDQVLYAPVHATAEVVRVELMDYQNATADRSLGFCEVPVAKLAHDYIDDSKCPYRGNGRQSMREKLKQPNGTTKGVVEFDVEFLPAMHVEGANFIEQNRRLEAEQRQKEGVEEDPYTGSPLDSPDAKAAAGAATRAGQAYLQDDDETEGGEEEGLHLTKEQLLSSQSGIIVFNLIKGEILRSRAQLEVVFDDSYWAAHTTERRKQYDWDEVGEAVIRELDVSNVWFRLRTGKRDSDVFAEYTCTTKSLLERALDGPIELYLQPTGANGAMDPSKLLDAPGSLVEKGKNASGAMKENANPQNLANMPGKMLDSGQDLASKGADKVGQIGTGDAFMAQGGKVLVSCRYIPMDIHLEPIESVVNQGSLTIEVLHCNNLASADRGGKSDPYVLFQDNGETLARTKTVRRNLNPRFNEVLPEVLIKSRLTREYRFNVRDWDQVGASDPLGTAYVNLAELEPFETYERTLPLTGEGALEDSTITVRLTFHPRYLNNLVGKFGNAMGNMASGVIGGIGNLGKGVATGGMSFGQQIMSAVGIKHHDKEHPTPEEAAQQYAEQSGPPKDRQHDEAHASESGVQGEHAPSSAHPPNKDPMDTSNFKVDNSSKYSLQDANESASLATNTELGDHNGPQPRRRRGIPNPFKKLAHKS